MSFWQMLRKAYSRPSWWISYIVYLAFVIPLLILEAHLFHAGSRRYLIALAATVFAGAFAQARTQKILAARKNRNR